MIIGDDPTLPKRDGRRPPQDMMPLSSKIQ